MKTTKSNVLFKIREYNKGCIGNTDVLGNTDLQCNYLSST